MMILVIHHLVVQMLNARMEFANACQNTKEILIQCVDPNVSLTMIVLVISHVSETNVLIHVLVLVDKTLFAM